MKTNATTEANFDKRVSAKSDPYFVLLATNKQIIGTSEMYSSSSARDNGVASVQKNAPIAAVVELEA